MVDVDMKAGQQVLLPDNQCGKVVEVDHAYHAARVQLNTGAERWARLDELEVIEPWNTYSRNGGAA